MFFFFKKFTLVFDAIKDDGDKIIKWRHFAAPPPVMFIESRHVAETPGRQGRLFRHRRFLITYGCHLPLRSSGRKPFSSSGSAGG